MDRKLIKELIEALAASDLAELEYRSDGETLRLVKRAKAASAPAHSGPQPSATQTPIPPPSDKSEAAGPGTIAAPLFGIVHLQQTPGAPPFVLPGQSVTAGEVICAIEAMKVLNQIRAERDCVVAAVLVQSGQEVEAGQPLFELG